MRERVLELPPGAWTRGEDHWGSLSELALQIPTGALIVLDRRVARLHPKAVKALRGRDPRVIVTLTGGESAKTLTALEKILLAGHELPRAGTVVAVGGGTIGDVTTVAAHLLKRGTRLIQVPTTVLAAVDSSLGGKGAIDLGSRGRLVKNLAGAFHSAEKCLIAPEFFETLSAAQRREGAIEAWKMIVCLDAKRWSQAASNSPAEDVLIREARRIKGEVCSRDPYERTGLRRVLNFGHTFGHVLESLSGFRLAHGEAVGLGMLCSLDVGRRLGVTDERVASVLETRLQEQCGVRSRKHLARVMSKASVGAIASLLRADKKVDAEGRLQMVLLKAPGDSLAQPVGEETWRPLLAAWRKGARP